MSSGFGARVIVLSDAIRIQLDAEPETLTAISELNSPGTQIAFLGVSDTPNLPLAPAHLIADKQLNGDVLISWQRRGRLSGNRWPTGEIPLDSLPEQYSVSVMDAGTVARIITTNTTQFNYSIEHQIADFGTAPSQFEFSVTQNSATLGCGHAATGVFN